MRWRKGRWGGDVEDCTVWRELKSGKFMKSLRNFVREGRGRITEGLSKRLIREKEIAITFLQINFP